MQLKIKDMLNWMGDDKANAGLIGWKVTATRQSIESQGNRATIRVLKMLMIIAQRFDRLYQVALTCK